MVLRSSNLLRRKKMVDIAMCEGGNCPLKESCYRFKATPSPYAQSYFAEIPYDAEEDGCDHYWGVYSDKKLKKLDKINEF
jgi:hypothetical protein